LATVVLFCALTALPAFPTEQPYESGNAYLRVCSVLEKDADTIQGDNELRFIQCLAYVQGLYDGIVFEAEYATMFDKRTAARPFCVPENLETGQMARILLKFLRNNPDKAHLQTKMLFGAALKDVFACPKR